MLTTLAADPGVSQAELARRVMVKPQSMSESLSRLAEAGLIARGNVEPGLAARVQLTDKGRKLLTKAYPVIEEYHRESFAALTSAERAEFARMLKKLIR